MGTELQPTSEISVEKIKAPALAKPTPEIRSEYKQEAELYRYGVQTEGEKQDIAERKKYAHRIFCLICSWLGAVFVLLLLAGFGGLWRMAKFSLPDSVVLAVIGSTTVNVLGIFYIVTHYLFPKR